MGSERGDVGVRILLVLGLVVAAVWVLPFLVLGDQPVQPDGDLGEPTLGESVGATDAPVATGPVAAGPAATGSAADPIGSVQDVEAQSMMNEAIRVAQVYFAEHGTYDGFGPDAAAEIDPSIIFTEGVAGPRMVGIVVTPTTVVLVTEVEGDGGPMCAAAVGDVVTFGRTNATTPDDCRGGW